MVRTLQIWQMLLRDAINELLSAVPKGFMSTNTCNSEIEFIYLKECLPFLINYASSTKEIVIRRKNGRQKKWRTAEDTLGEGCGGLDEGKCLGSRTPIER